MLKVAFATKDGAAVDQHFGWCQRFDIYDVWPDRAELAEIRTLAPAAEDESNKIESRLAAVADVAIVHLADIGGTAAAKVVNARIHPVKVPSGTPVSELLSRLEAVLAGTPPPWLRKVLRDHESETPTWSPS